MRNTALIFLAVLILLGVLLSRKHSKPGLLSLLSGPIKIQNPKSLPPTQLSEQPQPVPVKQRYERATLLSKKVLKTAQEKLEFARLASDIGVIDQVDKLLKDTSEKAQSEVAMEERMQAIDFLGEALDVEENPQHEKIIHVIVGILERPIRDLHVSKSLKAALAGDQIELFDVLHGSAPELAEEIYSLVGPDLQRLYTFAKNSHQTSEKGEE